MDIPIVSIIIPTFNRADLIEETINSIISQTYNNWECLIVDDQSTDNTKQVVTSYLKDSRFKYYQRPATKPKGGNSCRNYGFELSKGNYIHWFDSDDLMTTNHLEVLVNALLQNKNLDFVVGESINFEDVSGKEIGKPYNFDRLNKKITLESYAKQQVGWITNDFLGKREVLTDIRFNEKIFSGQEYNFFVQLLTQNVKGTFINNSISKRRVHIDSINSQIQNDPLKYLQAVLRLKFLTFTDIKNTSNPKLKKWFLSGYMQYAYKIALHKKLPKYYIKAIFKICQVCGFKSSFYFALSIISALSIGKGYLLLSIAKKKLEN